MREAYENVFRQHATEILWKRPVKQYDTEWDEGTATYEDVPLPAIVRPLDGRLDSPLGEVSGKRYRVVVLQKDLERFGLFPLDMASRLEIFGETCRILQATPLVLRGEVLSWKLECIRHE